MGTSAVFQLAITAEEEERVGCDVLVKFKVNLAVHSLAHAHTHMRTCTRTHAHALARTRSSHTRTRTRGRGGRPGFLRPRAQRAGLPQHLPALLLGHVIESISMS